MECKIPSGAGSGVFCSDTEEELCEVIEGVVKSIGKVKVKQSRYRPRAAQRVTES